MNFRYKCLYHLMTFFYTTERRRSIFKVVKLRPRYRSVKGKKYTKRIDEPPVCQASTCKNDAEFRVEW